MLAFWVFHSTLEGIFGIASLALCSYMAAAMLWLILRGLWGNRYNLTDPHYYWDAIKNLMALLKMLAWPAAFGYISYLLSPEDGQWAFFLFLGFFGTHLYWFEKGKKHVLNEQKQAREDEQRKQWEAEAPLRQHFFDSVDRERRERPPARLADGSVSEFGGLSQQPPP